jgi:hypothetical protein
MYYLIVTTSAPALVATKRHPRWPYEQAVALAEMDQLGATCLNAGRITVKPPRVVVPYPLPGQERVHPAHGAAEGRLSRPDAQY